MNEMNLERIKEIFRDCDLTPRSYSGRGMYGRNCLGVVCGNPMADLLQVVSSVAENAEDPQEVADFINTLGRPSTDNMGRDAIVYFEALPWEDSPDEVVEEMVDAFGGHEATGSRTLDGVTYEHAAFFDEEEDANNFIEEAGIEVSARNEVNGNLKVFFNMPKKEAA